MKYDGNVITNIAHGKFKGRLYSVFMALNIYELGHHFGVRMAHFHKSGSTDSGVVGQHTRDTVIIYKNYLRPVVSTGMPEKVQWLLLAFSLFLVSQRMNYTTNNQ